MGSPRREVDLRAAGMEGGAEEAIEEVGESSSPPRGLGLVGGGGIAANDIENKMFTRLGGNGNGEAVSNPDFKDQLEARFSRLPHRLMSVMGSNENTAEVSRTLCSSSSQAMKPSNTDSFRASKKRRSEIWNHYSEVEDQKDKAKCNYCHFIFSANPKNGTSHLHKHTKNCKSKKSLDRRQKQLIGNVASKDGVVLNELTPYSFDQERSREDLARMVILQELPFTTVEHPAFQKFVRDLRPEFHVVSRTTLASDCFKAYEKEKRRFDDLFKANCGRISLTSDMWTSNQTLGYMCLTAHYITNDWKLKKHIISFKMVPSPHTGLVISDCIASCILSWSIEKRLGSITVDNLPANTIAAMELQRKFRRDLLLDGKFFHVRCCAHILNLIVKDGLKIVEGALHRIREAVKYVKSSQARLETFMEIVKQLKMNDKKKICIDVPTHWNSTYLMLDDAIQFKDVFMRLEAQDSNFEDAPTEEDWSQGTIICNFLKVFHHITKIFSQTKSPTTNLYFYEIWRIQMLLIQESRSSNAVVTMIALKMQEEFDKYWKQCSHILAVGVVLDPRYKMKLIKYCFQKIYGNGDRASFEIKKVYDVLQNLYDDYTILYGANVSHVQVEVMVSTSHGRGDESFFLQDYKKFMREKEVAQPSKSEIEMYLEEKVHSLGDQNFDILDYWRFNESKYPILSRMVRDILAIPVSTVAFESAFSTAGRVLDDFRSSLSSDMVEALICTQDWLRDTLPHLADDPPPHTNYKVEDYETAIVISTDD